MAILRSGGVGALLVSEVPLYLGGLQRRILHTRSRTMHALCRACHVRDAHEGGAAGAAMPGAAADARCRECRLAVGVKVLQRGGGGKHGSH